MIVTGGYLTTSAPNSFSAGALPRIPLQELTALPQTLQLVLGRPKSMGERREGREERREEKGGGVKGEG